MNLPRRTWPPSQPLQLKNALPVATHVVHISIVTLTLTWQSCPGKSLPSNSFKAGPMSYRASIICVMFSTVDSVIDECYSELGLTTARPSADQIWWFKKHMRACACDSDTTASEAVDVLFQFPLILVWLCWPICPLWQNITWLQVPLLT
jgi:hypothetical protein